MYEPKCPFRAEADSHDTVCLSVEYDNGVLCTFNEVYYAPEETCVINAYGPRGQIHVDLHRANLTRQERMKRMDADSVGNGIFGKTYDVRFPLPKAAHGGSDYLMMKAFLETLQHGIAHPEATTLQEGIDTMALGIAARTAIKTGQVVNVQDILAAG